MRPTPEEISQNVKIGEAMAVFFADASPGDYALKDRVDKAISEAFDTLPPTVTTRHLGMAVLDSAQLLIEFQLSKEQEKHGYTTVKSRFRRNEHTE